MSRKEFDVPAAVSLTAAAGLRSCAELHAELGAELSLYQVQTLHQAARKACNDALITEKKILTRASPLLPQAIKMGMKDSGASVQDYKDWFGGRALTFAAPGDVASMFSPAAYLVTLYREARELYPEGNPWHIDARRPDLQGLELSQANLDTPVGALSLSNEILMAKLSHHDVSLDGLARHVGSGTTPYHHHHNRFRQAHRLKDPTFAHMWAAPHVTKHLSSAARVGILHAISPALYELLTDEITRENADEKFPRYFPGTMPEEMLRPDRLREWFGLDDRLLMSFINGGAKVNEERRGAQTDRAELLKTDGVVYQVGVGATSEAIHYAHLFFLGGNRWQLSFKLKLGGVIRFDVKDALQLKLTPKALGEEQWLAEKEYHYPFTWKGPAEGRSYVEYRIKLEPNAMQGRSYDAHYAMPRLSPAQFLLRLNKTIRLHKATGLCAAQLNDIIDSENPEQITRQTLATLAHTSCLSRRHDIAMEDALVMAGKSIGVTARAGEASQFDRLFNDPPLIDGGLSCEDYVMLDLHPSKAEEQADVKATLKRACQTDDQGLYTLGQLLAAEQDADVRFATTLGQLSRLYALSIWGRVHGLAPVELQLVLEALGTARALGEAPAVEWTQVLERLTRLCGWMDERGWTVHDLSLMIRKVDEIPPSTEISNLLKDMATAVANASLPETPGAQDYVRALSALMASVFGLSGETAAQALLNWAHRAKPGGLSLVDAGAILTTEAPTEEQQEQVTAFAYGLAQMALIVHATGVTADVLTLLVERPQALSPEAVQGDEASATLACNVEMVTALADFCTWLKKLPDPAGASGALITALGGDGVPAKLLAQASGQAEMTIAQAIDQARWREDIADAAALVSWYEIAVVLQWISLATTFGVQPVTIGAMIKLDYLSGSWAAWQTLADAFQAGLTRSQGKRAHSVTDEALSGALAGFLAAQEHAGVEQLNQHLLLDSLNGAQVMTSRIAEATAALQMFIHRTLSDPEDKHALKTAALDRQFFRDWTRWNARYATWSAGQMLMYYPENYIDPTVRLGQTKAMDSMLQTLGQAQINDDTVGDAFHGYLGAFEEVANLETISGYHASRLADTGKSWFIGRSRGEPRQYWWRAVDEGKRGSDGVLPANAWTGWTKIDMAPQVHGRLIRPVIYRERLYLLWVERQEHLITRDDEGKPRDHEWRWSYKLAWLRYDGTWSAPLDYPLSDDVVAQLECKEKPKADCTKIPKEDLAMFLSMRPGRNALLVGLYDRRQAPQDDTEGPESFGGLEIREDLSSREVPITGYLKQVRHWLDSAKHTGMCAVFDGEGKPVSGDIRSEPGSVPEGFKVFDIVVGGLNVIDTSDTEEGTYSLHLDTTLVVEAVRPEIENVWITALVNEYSALLDEDETLPVLARSGHGAFMARKEDNEYWGYLCVSRARFKTFFPDLADSIVDVFDVPLPGEPGKFDRVQAAQGEAHMGRFRIATLGYPLQAVNVRFNFARDREAGTTHNINIASLLYHPAGAGAEKVTPRRYKNPLGKVAAADIQRTVHRAKAGEAITEQAKADFDLAGGPQQVNFSSTLKVGDMREWDDAIGEHLVRFQFGKDHVREWTISVFKEGDTLQTAIIGETAEGAQYLKRNGWVTRLNTLFARQLTERAALGIDTILSYETQQIPEPGIEGSGENPLMDFAGANALYFWELFYYTPMMVMQRFLQEERFDLAEQWLTYIFNPAGYTVHGQYTRRMWNVRPLEEDTAWNDEPLKALDPDAVAQNDPMHYKLHVFMRLVDITLGRGDAAYRKLERDTLSEAKVWYQRALRLLGDAPWIEASSAWDDPSLGEVASEQTLEDRMQALALMTEGVRAEDVTHLRVIAGDRAEAGRTSFLPEANRMLLGYWEALRIRLYNLRHNLSLDGQPLNLPLYAKPADPKALLAAAVAAQAGGENALPEIKGVPALRFTPLLESARAMTSHLILFGNTMRLLLERQDAEALVELLNTQGAELSASSVALQEQSLQELQAETVRLTALKDAAQVRHDHYRALYDEFISDAENLAMSLTLSKKALLGTWGSLAVSEGLTKTFPNVFGTSNGGGQPGGPLKASATLARLGMTGLKFAEAAISKKEKYRRRRQDWEIQYKSAEKLIAIAQAQLDALAVRETSIKMQVAHTQAQAANAAAQLAFHQGKMTAKPMYSWLRARLASIFYSYYDLTVSRCMMAQSALQWEKGDTTTYLRTGTWNGAWAGLLCGEGLMLALGQMEDAWVKWQKRELEVTRAVSLASVFEGSFGKDSGGNPSTLSEAIVAVLAGEDVECTLPLSSVTYESNRLSVQFGLNQLGLAEEFAAGTCRVRRIRVSLEGANVESSGQLRARLMTNYTGLPAGCDQSVISHARNDDGLFPQEGGNAATRWLPFEGLNIALANDEDDTWLTLSFPDAKEQSVLVDLKDITLHVQFTVR
ncbi:neuraminidase-like domain-containing protein [Pseudomonas guariconensis]|uniref:Tc toxin subunit A-related protein n=1 Tax=Pseudomonas guariconensis TaxID=1288410 RepID=UPI0018AA0658|nr:neuraminidase-like domain-containing protein [Pseudomonas guariconensis]MBF8739677.1 hypothetical protein [Pseudomonas guariconensis]MBF8749179.1 hypothetical protein [Pseudomonas guariconensis]